MCVIRLPPLLGVFFYMLYACLSRFKTKTFFFFVNYMLCASLFKNDPCYDTFVMDLEI